MRSPFLFLVLLTGCPEPTDKDTSGGGPDDTGGPDTYEPGCITVDGGGGYAKLADAITLAPEGAVIELCDGTYEEAVTVDKGVTIRGQSVDGVTLTGPGSDVPLTITGAGVTIENLVVSSPRTGITLDGASDAVLSSITVSAAGSWGVSASNSTASISDLTLVDPAAGGVEVSGGEVSITGATIDYPGAYGVWVGDGGVLTLDSAVVTGALTLGGDVTADGHALHVEDGTVEVIGSTLDASEGMAVMADGGDLTLTDTVLSNSAFLGIYAFDSTYTLSGVSVTGTYFQGIYATGTSFDMSSSTVDTDSELACSYAYADWGTEDYGPWCGGMLVAADTISLTDVSISGWNNYGFYLAPDAEDATTVTITGGTIDDVGRWGAYFYTAEGTVTDFTVQNMREPELTDPCGGYIDQSVGFLPVYSDLTIDGLTAANNAGWGMSSVVGTNTVTGSTFDGNGCAGLMNYQSSLTIDSSTFSNGGQYGGLYDYQGATVATGNTFTGNRSGYSYEYESGGVIYGYSYDSGYGQDFLSVSSSAVVLTGNTFTGGDDSIYAQYPTSIEVSGNTWSDYNGTIFYAYFASEESPAVFRDNTVDDIVGPVVETDYGYTEVENVTIGTTRTATVTYTSYEDGVETGGYSYTTSSYPFSSYGYYYEDTSSGTVTEYPAGLSIADVTVTSSYSTLVSVSDASLEIDNLEAESVGGYAVYGSWSSYAPDLDVEGLTVGTASYTGFYLYNSGTQAGSASLSDVSIDSVGGYGVYAQGLGAVTLTDVAFGSVSSHGVYTVSRGYDYEYYYDSSTGSYTVWYTDIDAETAVEATGLSMSSVYGDGMHLEGGSATLSNVTIEGATGDGVSTAGLTSLTLSDVTIVAPGSVGVGSTDALTYYSYENSAYEVADGDTAVSLTSVTVTDATDRAFYFEGGSVTMTSSTGTSAGSSGLELVETTADIQGNVFTDNSGYGMVCETVTLSACTGNDLAGNTLGQHSGCDDACGE